MFVKGTVNVEFIAGKTPGSLSALVGLTTDEGVLVQLKEPVLVTAGQILTYGPVAVELNPLSDSTVAKTPAVSPLAAPLNTVVGTPPSGSNQSKAK